jgi:glycosyltransferase involved in cell wall biosynthesis
MPTISACLITKNEENNILRCLKSIKDKVDEIIIVDTGSTDSTKHLAKRFTDKIYNLKWEEADGLGNFARARNYSLSKAKSDYVFWIDADEELFDLNGSFRSLVDDNSESVLFRQAHCLTQEDHEYSTDQLHDRLFRRGDIQFVGVVHEYPSLDGREYLPNSKFQSDCIILHYGLANLRVKGDKSIKRNGPLIEKNLRLNPDNPVAQYYLLALYWSMFVFDLDNTEIPVEAFKWWDEVLSKNNNTWIKKMSITVLQNFFKHSKEEPYRYDGALGRSYQEAEYFSKILRG